MTKLFLIGLMSAICVSSYSQLASQTEFIDFSFEEESEVVQEPTDTTWWKGGLFAINLSQVSLNNWAAGGQSSVSGVALASFFANHKKGKSVWDNSLDLAYGLLKQGEADFIKSDDKIDLASKYGQEGWNEKWYYSALLNFRTQFVEGLDAPGPGANRISDFLAPGYLLTALGLDYKPNDGFSLFISPVTGKFTFVTDDLLAAQGAFGVDPGLVDTENNIIEPGSNSRSELGAYARGQFSKDLMENVNFLTRIDLFSNYKDNPDHIDVNWEALLGMKVNKYISATLGAQAIYDHDIDVPKDEDGDGISERTGKGTQFKEVLNIGFLYNF